MRGGEGRERGMRCQVIAKVKSNHNEREKGKGERGENRGGKREGKKTFKEERDEEKV